MPNVYQSWRKKIIEMQVFTDSLPFLKTLFPIPYYEMVGKQIDDMELKAKGRRKLQSGPINSMFIFLVDDSQNGFTQTKLLENYISLIFAHPSIRKRDKEYIIAQMKTSESTDMLFEISVLGNLVKQFPVDKIELYPRTTAGHNVESRVFLDDRWVYLEVTVINDNETETKAIDALINQRRRVGSSSFINFDQDKLRYIRKLQSKSQQFFPNKPNVLIVSVQGTRPLLIHPPFEAPDPSVKVANVGLVMEFNRKRLVNSTTNNCDPTCGLTGAETNKLKAIITGNGFEQLVYGA